MGSFETTFDLDIDLTFIKVVGKVTAEDFHAWTADYYSGPTTKLNLWDLRQADLSAIGSDDLLEDAVRSKKVADRRQGGKTAVVSDKALEFGIARMRAVYAEIMEMPFAFQVFQTMAEARAWLGV